MARPKGSKDERPWTEALRKALARREKPDGPQNLDLVAQRCVKSALEGDTPAMKEIGDRLEGKPAQATVVSGDPSAPIEHRVVHSFESPI